MFIAGLPEGFSAYYKSALLGEPRHETEQSCTAFPADTSVKISHSVVCRRQKLTVTILKVDDISLCASAHARY
jgi:hypothetical protein